MEIIFIDANIYLNFFDSNKPILKKLLDVLLEIKDNIFISSQIVDEVNRNKLDIACKSLRNYLENLSKVKPINLPEHLEMESTDLQEWNNQIESLHQQQKALQGTLQALIHKTLEEIMLSSDKVSVTFNSLFNKAFEASEQEIQSARIRRERGNPPGKFDNPLGDQISWEQFLNNSCNSRYIWIITNDSDYYTTFNNKIYLNPLLYNELIRRSNVDNPSIFCFQTLADGIKDFNEYSSKKIDNLPTEEELNTISEEELSDSSSQGEKPRIFSVIEEGEFKYIDLPSAFNSPNQYIQYLRTYDSYER